MLTVPGGGKDLETVAIFGEKKISTAPSPAPKQTTDKIFKMSSPIGAPSSSSPSSFKATGLGSVKGIGNLNTAGGKQIRFIPPKVNTANNRVPAGQSE